MTKWIETCKRYWWIPLAVALFGVAVGLWRSERATTPSPAAQEITDRAISATEEIDRQLEILRGRVNDAEKEVKSRAHKATTEVADLDCQALAARWNRIIADERARRSGISADVTPSDGGSWGMGE